VLTMCRTGTWRVNGTLGVARSIGDSEHAAVVIASPDSIERDITPDDSFVMLVCAHCRVVSGSNHTRVCARVPV
jgi:hypothetical protein